MNDYLNNKMVRYSKDIVRCNFCITTFPRESGVDYYFPGSKLPLIKCPKCDIGHLWLFDTEVNEKQLEKDKYDREHPSLGEKIKNAIHLHDRPYTKPEPFYGTKLHDGFKMLSDDE